VKVLDVGRNLICMEHRIFEPEGLDGFEIKIGPDRVAIRPTCRPASLRMIAIPNTLSGTNTMPAAS
jgi:maleylacetate reductase